MLIMSGYMYIMEFGSAFQSTALNVTDMQQYFVLGTRIRRSG